MSYPITTIISGDTQKVLSALVLDPTAKGLRFGFDLFKTEANGFRIYDNEQKANLVGQYVGDPLWQERPTGPGAAYVTNIQLFEV